MRRLAAVLLVPAALVMLVSFGVSDAARAQSSPTAHAQFVATADDICYQSALRMEQHLPTYETQKIAGLGTKGGARAAPDEVTKYVLQVAIPEMTSQIASLTKLTPPTADAKPMSDALVAANAGLAEMKAHPDQVVYGNPFSAAREQFVAIGMTSCGSSKRPSEPSSSKSK